MGGGEELSQVNDVVVSALHCQELIPRHLVSPADSLSNAHFNQPHSFPAVEEDRPSEVISSHGHPPCPWSVGVHYPVFRVSLGSWRLLLPIMKTGVMASLVAFSYLLSEADS